MLEVAITMQLLNYNDEIEIYNMGQCQRIQLAGDKLDRATGLI